MDRRSRGTEGRALQTDGVTTPATPREAATASGPALAPGARRLALEGSFQALAQGLGETYLTAFALWLGGGPLALGLIATLPTGATALAQVAAKTARAGAAGARRFIAGAWCVQALGYAALGLCVFLPAAWDVPVLCAVAFLAWGLGGLAVPAWTSLVSEVVPRAAHGRFFGLRGVAQQFGVLAAILAGGLLLGRFRASGLEGTGFVALFLLAGLSRIADTGLLAGVADRGRTRRAAVARTGLQLLRSSGKFRRLAFYLWGLHFATHVATPFFVPYMLRDLQLSYAHVGALLSVPAAVKTLTLGRWGRLADRVGPGPILRSAGWLVAPVPALWLVSGSPWWILAIQAWSGFVWGAFEVAQASSFLQTTRGREAAVAFFNLVDGAVLIAGSLLGGLVVRLSGAAPLSGYLIAMGLSALLRVVPAATLLWRVRGIGRPAWPHRRMPLRVWAVRPSRGISLRPWADLAPAAEDGADEEDEERRPASGPET